MPTPIPFALAAFFTGALAVWGKVSNRLPVHWLCKPLTMGILLAAALVVPSHLPPSALPWLYAALALSLLGDVFLMFKDRYFKAGLVAFLLAHVAYLVCFAIEVPWHWSDAMYAVLPLACGLLVLRFLWPHLGRLRPAVLLYVVALTLVATRLLARGRMSSELGLTSVTLSGIGAALFVAADSVLAIRHFAKREVPYALELFAYFGAQWCIVWATWT